MPSPTLDLFGDCFSNHDAWPCECVKSLCVKYRSVIAVRTFHYNNDPMFTPLGWYDTHLNPSDPPDHSHYADLFAATSSVDWDSIPWFQWVLYRVNADGTTDGPTAPLPGGGIIGAGLTSYADFGNAAELATMHVRISQILHNGKFIYTTLNSNYYTPLITGLGCVDGVAVSPVPVTLPAPDYTVIKLPPSTGYVGGEGLFPTSPGDIRAQTIKFINECDCDGFALYETYTP